MPVRFDVTGIKKKLEKLDGLLQHNVREALADIGEKWVEDITGGRTKREGKAWSRAVDQFFQAYDMENSGNLMAAVVSSLVVTNKSVYFSPQKLDSATATPGYGGLGYWRLFEYGGALPATPVAGQRSKASKSQNYRFVPLDGWGRNFQGFAVFGGSHPGVYPTRMFQDTFELNRKFMKEKLQQAVSYAAKGKAL